MLEQFLKFFRGDSEESEPLQGSYLSHLLDEIEPHLVEELEQCPEHDPLPLLVALTLRKTGGSRFDHQPGCPVVDAESSSLEPPPPPAPSADDAGGPAPPPAPDAPPEDEDGESDDENATAEGAEGAEDDEDDEDPKEVSEQDEKGEDASEQEDASDDATDEDEDKEVAEQGDEDEDEEASEQGDEDEDEEASEQEEDERDEEASEQEEDERDEEASEQEKDEDDGEDDEGSEEEASADGDEKEEASDQQDDEASDSEIDHAESREEDETDEYEEVQPEGLVDEEPEAAPDDLETDVEDIETAVEAEANRAPETGVLEDDEPSVRVDSEIVLEMGRVFLGMLVENDCLPVELQMSPEEIDQARKLLAGYFLGDEGLEPRARQMLQQVEEKFDEGMFSQARILLQLFDADDSTRIENDRNLFYEEMILRFGIQRRHPVGEGIQENLEDRLETFREEDGELDDLFDWLAETIYVSFDLYGRDSEAVERWRELAERSERPEAADRLLDVIPPKRWRLLSYFSDPAVDLLDTQLTRDYVADYVIEHVKTCYFVLRAVGDTGLEPYLDVFFDWIDEEFDVDGTAMLPTLYNETTANERLVDDIFDDLYADKFEEAVEAQRQDWTSEDLEEAVDGALAKLADTDLSEIPPGHYDFGRFVLDELFDIEYPTDEFPYKMHRIT